MFKNNWQLHFIEVARLMRDVEFDPSAWSRVLAYIGQAIGASSGAMAVRDRHTLELLDPVATTWPLDALGVYLDREQPLEADPVLARLTEMMFQQPDSTSFSSLELLDVSAYTRSRFFNEFAHPFDIPYLTGTCFALDSQHSGAFFFHRPLSIPEFERDQRQFLEALTPLINIGLRCRPLQRQLVAARGVLDHVNLAVVTIDENGRVTDMNRRAKQFIERSRALHIRDRRLASPWPDVDTNIARICHQATRGYPPCASELFISDIHDRRVRADSPRSFTQLVALPLSEEGSISLWRDRVPAVVFLCHSDDPATSVLDAETVLRGGFGCSPAQARVGALYGLGLKARDIAAAIQVSVPTVRKHIDAVRVRTHSEDKIELAARIQAMLIPVRDD